MNDERIFAIVVGIVFGIIGLGIWWYRRKIIRYQKAKEEIFNYVRSYKGRCSGANRFLVTISDLQDAFREYDTPLIEKVFQELIKNRVIERDPMDQEWCVK